MKWTRPLCGSAAISQNAQFMVLSQILLRKSNEGQLPLIGADDYAAKSVELFGRSETLLHPPSHAAFSIMCMSSMPTSVD